MTITDTSSTTPVRQATAKTVLMCRPDFFTVSYSINPWMNPNDPTDTSLAVKQWQTLYDTYIDLGFTVELIDPIQGLPDMVYAANGGFVIDGKAYGALFTYDERKAEGPAYMDWFGANGFEVASPENVNEGEGDFLLVGDNILAGMGFRTSVESHRELAELSGRNVVSLNLINPSFYHVDTAIAKLDDTNIAYLESPLSKNSVHCTPTLSSPLKRMRQCSDSTPTATVTTSSSPPARKTSSVSSPSAATTPSASTCRSCCWVVAA